MPACLGQPPSASSPPADASFLVQDANEESWDKLHPWLCPGVSNLTADPAPSNAVITDPSGTSLILDFDGVKNGLDSSDMEAQEQNMVYGYKITIYYQDPDTEEWITIDGYNGKLYRIYLDTTPYGTGELVESSSGAYTLTLASSAVKVAGVAATTGWYRAEVTAFYMDGVESTVASAVAVDFDWA